MTAVAVSHLHADDWLAARPILDAWAGTFRAAGFTEKTVASRFSGVASFHARTGADPLAARPEDVIAWLASPSLSPNSRASYFQTFAQWSKFLVGSGIRDDDPTANLRAPRFPQGVPRPLPLDQVRHLLEHVGGGRSRSYVLLAAYQGLRVHEIAKLRGSDMDTASLRVMGKGGKDAVLPTHPLVWAEAAKYPPKGFWFPSRNDPRQPVPPGSVTQTVRRAMLAAGIDGSAHQLRHTFGTQVLKAAGGNLRVAQELLRHSSPVTTALYTLVDDEQRRSAVLALPNYEAGPPDVPVVTALPAPGASTPEKAS